MKTLSGFKKLLIDLPEPPEGKTGWPWNEETSGAEYKDTNNFPKISIITPSLNQGQYLEQTIRSVLLQNYPNLEYVIIDGGSNDESFEIIKKYGKWLKYYVSEKDKGQSDAINKGLNYCNGEIFNWLNSDDYYNKSTFRLLAEGFNNNNIDVVVGRYRFFFENEDRDKIVDFKLRRSLEQTIALVAINQPSTFFRLGIFKGLGGIDDRLHFIMDQDIWIKYLFTYGQDKIKIIDSDLANFRFHSNSKTSKFKFMSEYIGIFYSIAKKAGMDRHSGLLKKIYGNDIESHYAFNYNFTGENIILAKKVINNFLYFTARNAFTTTDMKTLNLCLQVLENKWLNEEQKNYLLILKIKSKLIKFKLSPVMNLLGKKIKNKDLEPKTKIKE